MIELRKISDFFEIHSGDYHAMTELDSGDIPLISCGELNNGLVGHFNIPEETTYENVITVAYNGRPLTAKFHPYRFGAKDDVAVLLPRQETSEATWLYVAAQLNYLRWRYSYGRKCFKAKLEYLMIPLPLKRGGDGHEIIDQDRISKAWRRSYVEYLPEPQKVRVRLPSSVRWQWFKINDIFELNRGDFHSIANLDPGNYATISRVTTNNGLVGYFDKPDGAVVYPGAQITVSTVGGDAFVQMNEFMATDNVLVCVPKTDMSKTTLFFIAFILNNQKWRYSYGRQPYKTKFEKSIISLPIKSSGELDQDFIDKSVKATSYWPQVEAAF